jgi:hypothetical protein
VFAVSEAIFLLEQPGAHDAFVISLGLFVDVLVREVYCPGFVGEHTHLIVGIEVVALFFLLLVFIPPSMLLSGSDRFTPPFPVAAGSGVGSFIAKVEGSSMWK